MTKSPTNEAALPHQTQTQSSWVDLVVHEETGAYASRLWESIGLHSGDFCDKGDLVLQLRRAGAGRKTKGEKSPWVSLVKLFCRFIETCTWSKMTSRPEVRVLAEPSGCGQPAGCPVQTRPRARRWGEVTVYRPGTLDNVNCKMPQAPAGVGPWILHSD